MQEIVQVKLREAGQCTYFYNNGLALKLGDIVIVEQDRGLDYGHIACDAQVAAEPENKDNIKKVLRVATADDIEKIADNQLRAAEARKTCVIKIDQHRLDMKLVDCEYAFDRSKIIFYFTAEERIDFRELVKELAGIFKVRIELRQIGVRDEARLLGGLGSCGRELCCKTFLKDFVPVTIRMAKDEGLPLNPPKISGLCGRLMCCLAYEYDTYKEFSRGMPREGDKISTPEGKGKVVSVNILKRKAYVELEEGKQIIIDYTKK
ncbi:MAG: stage 0 sporulation family protein [Candidatus Omnitrophica bacterium]|nr:stage 0 sporulation family protein [Candidatus Omnitrophota bacterium]